SLQRILFTRDDAADDVPVRDDADRTSALVTDRDLAAIILRHQSCDVRDVAVAFTADGVAAHHVLNLHAVDFPLRNRRPGAATGEQRDDQHYDGQQRE